MQLGTYQHYKGKRYQVIGVGKDSETLVEVVIYKALYGEGQLWVRPLEMFMDEVELNDKKIKRFELLY